MRDHYTCLVCGNPFVSALFVGKTDFTLNGLVKNLLAIKCKALFLNPEFHSINWVSSSCVSYMFTFVTLIFSAVIDIPSSFDFFRRNLEST